MLRKILSSQTSLLQKTVNPFSTQTPKRVAVTGAAGQIGYSLLFRIASGQMLGPNQPVIIHLVDLPNMKQVLNGVKMELDDCAFPLLDSVVVADNNKDGFKDIDFAMLIGSKPRGAGQERADLIKDNGKIFVGTGQALNDYAKRTCKILVVGNPCNTNCLITQHYAKDIPKENFTAMTLLDHKRALSQIAQKANCKVTDIENLSIWGNHSPTMVPMLSNATINGQKATDILDHQWIDTYFNPKVGKRGAEIIEARKLSSAASAANSAIEHMEQWVNGSNGWTSMAILSDGSYGIPKDLIFSFPVVCKNGKYELIKGINIDQYYRKKLDITVKELIDERNAIEHLLK